MCENTHFSKKKKNQHIILSVTSLALVRGWPGTQMEVFHHPRCKLITGGRMRVGRPLCWSPEPLGNSNKICNRGIISSDSNGNNCHATFTLDVWMACLLDRLCRWCQWFYLWFSCLIELQVLHFEIWFKVNMKCCSQPISFQHSYGNS